MKKRTYVGEMEWALQMAYGANHDRNPNRFAQVNTALLYGIDVANARRSKAPIPERPDSKKAV